MQVGTALSVLAQPGRPDAAALCGGSIRNIWRWATWQNR
jgi:hypothetical protein